MSRHRLRSRKKQRGPKAIACAYYAGCLDTTSPHEAFASRPRWMNRYHATSNSGRYDLAISSRYPAEPTTITEGTIAFGPRSARAWPNQRL